MPVTKSAKKALRTSIRRHEENLLQKDAFKKAIKGVKKAIVAVEGDLTALFSSAQSTLDRAAKKHTIHPNKAARLKSRLAKRVAAAAGAVAPVAKAKVAAKKVIKKTPTKKASK
jgi:small subunit ribosomal protein S20